MWPLGSVRTLRGRQRVLADRQRCLDRVFSGILCDLYNTNVVTYRELPTGWDSLLEPRWKGRVAVPDPLKSDMAASVLTEAAKTVKKKNFWTF